MDPILIFKGATVLQSIAAYFGLIESVSADVKKLLHQSFVSAERFLNCAKNSNEENQKEYIKLARTEFVKATAVEDSENLISAYLGLSMCQYLLGDLTNAKLSFDEINKVELKKIKKVKSSAAKSVLVAVSLPLGLNPEVIDKVAKVWLNREEQFEEYKRRVLMIDLSMNNQGDEG